MSSVIPPSEPAFVPKHATAAPLLLENPRHALLQRLIDWRNAQLLKRALRQAGDPNLVLDLPCGNGRLWPLLMRHANRVVLAADSSADMLAQAEAVQPRAVVERVRLLQTSAFAIDLPENAVVCVLCMRLFRRLETSKQRLAMLAELFRVTSDTAIISLWVDNNYQSWKSANTQPQHTASGSRQRLLIPQAVAESEFRQAGFSIVGHHNLLPGYAAQRIYVLRKAL